MKFGYVTKFLIKIRPGLLEVRVLLFSKGCRNIECHSTLFMDYDIYGL